MGNKITKQEVVVAETNSNEAVITSGLAPDEKVFLSVPAGMENEDAKLLPELNGKRRKKEAKETKDTPKDSIQVTKPSI